MEKGARGDLAAGVPVAGIPAACVPDWGDWERPLRSSTAGMPATGSPAVPMLHLEGFDGPMDLLLDLAERQRIDWGRMSILALAEQFVASLEQLADRVPIERRADWLVMATRLVLLRSRLLFPESPVAAEAAERDAATELRRIDDLAEVREAAAWLSDRPVLGQDVFARGAPDRLGVYLEAEDEAEVVAFLWASLSLFEDETEQLDTVARYRPTWTDLYSVAEARDRILQILGKGGDGENLRHFLPEQPAAADGDEPPAASLRLCSAWASTFSASLELTKLGDVVLVQADPFASVRVSCPTAQPSAGHGSYDCGTARIGSFSGSITNSCRDQTAECSATELVGGDQSCRATLSHRALPDGYARPN
jgi:segregation and condensation protein A